MRIERRRRQSRDPHRSAPPSYPPHPPLARSFLALRLRISSF